MDKENNRKYIVESLIYSARNSKKIKYESKEEQIRFEKWLSKLSLEECIKIVSRARISEVWVPFIITTDPVIMGIQLGIWGAIVSAMILARVFREKCKKQCSQYESGSERDFNECVHECRLKGYSVVLTKLQAAKSKCSELKGGREKCIAKVNASIGEIEEKIKKEKSPWGEK